MKACPKLSLFLALACGAQSALCSYSESITGFNTVSDHFGSPPLGNATYDYVVIGGGTAGLTISARLAHENAGTVAVIEAGGFYEIDNSNRSSVPGTAAYFIGTAPLFKNALIDWEYQTEHYSVSIIL
ncbi:Versicolorin B synthase protein [Rutstroemia sp. NJR-2017a BVV2]|nr:Versicolorin B synthase protein [Rutstroemia sp. NJR-2017a BVV2]